MRNDCHWQQANKLSSRAQALHRVASLNFISQSSQKNICDGVLFLLLSRYDITYIWCFARFGTIRTIQKT